MISSFDYAFRCPLLFFRVSYTFLAQERQMEAAIASILDQFIAPHATAPAKQRLRKPVMDDFTPTQVPRRPLPLPCLEVEHLASSGQGCRQVLLSGVPRDDDVIWTSPKPWTTPKGVDSFVLIRVIQKPIVKTSDFGDYFEDIYQNATLTLWTDQPDTKLKSLTIFSSHHPNQGFVKILRQSEIVFAETNGERSCSAEIPGQLIGEYLRVEMVPKDLLKMTRLSLVALQPSGNSTTKKRVKELRPISTSIRHDTMTQSDETRELQSTSREDETAANDKQPDSIVNQLSSTTNGDDFQPSRQHHASKRHLSDERRAALREIITAHTRKRCIETQRLEKENRILAERIETLEQQQLEEVAQLKGRHTPSTQVEAPARVSDEQLLKSAFSMGRTVSLVLRQGDVNVQAFPHDVIIIFRPSIEFPLADSGTKLQSEHACCLVYGGRCLVFCDLGFDYILDIGWNCFTEGGAALRAIFDLDCQVASCFALLRRWALASRFVLYTQSGENNPLSPFFRSNHSFSWGGLSFTLLESAGDYLRFVISPFHASFFGWQSSIPSAPRVVLSWCHPLQYAAFFDGLLLGSEAHFQLALELSVRTPLDRLDGNDNSMMEALSKSQQRKWRVAAFQYPQSLTQPILDLWMETALRFQYDFPRCICVFLPFEDKPPARVINNFAFFSDDDDLPFADL